MELFNKIRALFKREEIVVPPPPVFSDEEFLEFIAAQARNRTRTEQATTTKAPDPAAPLGRVA